MSRCLACDTLLTDYEATRKGKYSGDYIELCSHCFNLSQLVDMPMVDRPELCGYVDVEED